MDGPLLLREATVIPLFFNAESILVVNQLGTWVDEKSFMK